MRTSTARSAPHREAAPTHRVALLLFALVFVIFAATAGYAVASIDVWAANYGSWLLTSNGSPNVTAATTPMNESPIRFVWIQQVGDHEVVARSAGVVAAGLPAYALGSSAAFSLVPAAVTAAFLSSITVLLVFLTLARYLPRREALLASAVFAFSTPVWSVAANGLWPHTLTILGISGVAWAASTDRWGFAGVFASISVWGRPHTAIIFGLVGCLAGLARRDLRITARLGSVTIGGVGLLMLWNRWMFHTWNPMAPYSAATTLDDAETQGLGLVNQLGIWIAPDRGILIWTPILLVLLPAVVRSWKDLPHWTRAMVWAGLTYTVMHASLIEFAGGDGFYGYRYTLELLTCVTPAFALSAHRMGRIARVCFAPVLAVQTCIILVGSVRDVIVVPSARIWHEHSFFTAVADSPQLGIALVATAVAMGLLGQRIWRDPGIAKS